MIFNPVVSIGDEKNTWNKLNLTRTAAKAGPIGGIDYSFSIICPDLPRYILFIYTYIESESGAALFYTTTGDYLGMRAAGEITDIPYATVSENTISGTIQLYNMEGIEPDVKYALVY